MAKYVYHVPLQDALQVVNDTISWRDLALSFGESLQDQLNRKFGLYTCVYPEESGVELDQGSAGMGKDWFNFKFRVFAGLAIYLDMINVPYEWRHKGVGLWLIEELKKWASISGLKYIFLGSYEPSNPFWESCGFVKITDYPDFVLGIDAMAK